MPISETVQITLRRDQAVLLRDLTATARRNMVRGRADAGAIAQFARREARRQLQAIEAIILTALTDPEGRP